ncbi:MAG: EAL domain-containing protein [Gammaproteobacteria bacterium]
MFNISVLLIEDNLGDAYLLQEYLSRGKLASYTIMHVLLLADGIKAMQENVYDVVFLDMGLPDGDSATIVSEVIKHANNMPVIVMTGNDDIHTGILSVKAGAQDFLIKGKSRDETVERSVHHAIERKRLLVELDELKEREHQLAMHDSLTGLVNRMSLKHQVENILQHAKRTEEKIAFLFIDLDRFKNINDSMGHDIGDAILIGVADRLKETLRESDIVARIGGDEFICILRDVVKNEGISTLAQKINATIQDEFIINDEALFIGCSIGISIYPDDGGTCEELITLADTAMYHAKEQGRNQYQFADSEIKKATQKSTMANELRQAFARDEFVVYYQPVIDAEAETVHSCEALVRWRHPQKGIIEPGLFIPEMEKTGLIVQLGEMVLEKVAQFWKSNVQYQFPDLRISVNISSLHFRQKTFVESLLSIFAEVDVETDWLDIEITESVLLHHEALVTKHFKLLNENGIKISIDDFGTGYSSFAYLRDYPLTALKINKSFVAHILSNRKDMAILKAILALSEQLDIKVIVEGVETLELLKTLSAMNCNFIQGFYYSMPLPADEFVKFMNEGFSKLRKMQVS